MASADDDDQASDSIAVTASRLPPPIRPTYLHRRRRWASPSASYHARVVGLSWVPV